MSQKQFSSRTEDFSLMNALGRMTTRVRDPSRHAAAFRSLARPSLVSTRDTTQNPVTSVYKRYVGRQNNNLALKIPSGRVV